MGQTVVLYTLLGDGANGLEIINWVCNKSVCIAIGDCCIRIFKGSYFKYFRISLPFLRYNCTVSLVNYSKQSN